MERIVEQQRVRRRPPLRGANAISIVRTAEDSGNQALADDTWLASVLRGPVMRLGNEHVMGVYVIWKLKNKAGEEVPRRPATRLSRALPPEQVLQLPAVDGGDWGGFKEIRSPLGIRTSRGGKYMTRTTIAEGYTTNPGHPGNTTPVMDEIFSTFLIPQMFAEVAQ